MTYRSSPFISLDEQSSRAAEQLAQIKELHANGHIDDHTLEYFYEGIFLRSVTAFENFLEELFFCLLVPDRRNPAVKELLVEFGSPLVGITFRDEAIARSVLLNGQDYLKWLPYKECTDRSAIFFPTGSPYVSLSQPRKDELSRVYAHRNAIAHQSPAAR